MTTVTTGTHNGNDGTQRKVNEQRKKNTRDKYAALLNIVNVAFIVCQINWMNECDIVVGASHCRPRNESELRDMSTDNEKSRIWNATAYEHQKFDRLASQKASNEHSQNWKQSQTFYANETTVIIIICVSAERLHFALRHDVRVAREIESCLFELLTAINRSSQFHVAGTSRHRLANTIFVRLC